MYRQQEINRQTYLQLM